MTDREKLMRILYTEGDTFGSKVDAILRAGFSRQVEPDWYKAPGWANWLAQDRDGSWFWYEKKPVKGAIGWKAIAGQADSIDQATDWQDSLEGRYRDYGEGKA